MAARYGAAWMSDTAGRTGCLGLSSMKQLSRHWVMLRLHPRASWSCSDCGVAPEKGVKSFESGCAESDRSPGNAAEPCPIGGEPSGRDRGASFEGNYR